jgi:hypothetical protein
MEKFEITSVVGGDTFVVSPLWKWNGQTGSRVRPTGYEVPELFTKGGISAKRKLNSLLLGEQVEIGDVQRVDCGRLVCDVYFRGRYLADYFPEYHNGYSGTEEHY